MVETHTSIPFSSHLVKMPHCRCSFSDLKKSDWWPSEPLEIVRVSQPLRDKECTFKVSISPISGSRRNLWFRPNFGEAHLLPLANLRLPTDWLINKKSGQTLTLYCYNLGPKVAEVSITVWPLFISPNLYCTCLTHSNFMTGSHHSKTCPLYKETP